MNKLIISSIVFGAVSLAGILGASQAHAAAQSCVDQTNADNFVTTITTDGSATITTKSKMPTCGDVTINYSSYTMPDSYSGLGFDKDPNSTPQAVFSTVTKTLPKGFVGPMALKIDVPADCKNKQLDIYLGSELTTITKDHRIGTQLIGSETYMKTGTCDTTPGQGSGTPTTPTTTTTELPSTGTSENLTVILAAVLAAGAYGVTRFVASKRNA